MLQQTRVAAVIPHYERFLRRFPTVEALARAKTESVLQYWAGLGYYARARNLHRAAKQIVTLHEGNFPRKFADALSLAGIGNYTASAILSIAYGKPYAVLDGNVARVLARLGGIGADLRAPQRWRQLSQAASSLLELSAPGDWNEAMMELGATVCTPRAPNCGKCPVRSSCRAQFLGVQEQLPAKRNKLAVERVSLAAGILLDTAGRTLLVRPGSVNDGDGAAALFSGLWQFPAVRVKKNAEAELRKELAALWKARTVNHSLKLTPLIRKKHTVTFRAITLAPYLARVEKLPEANGSEMKVVPFSAVKTLAVSSATRKIAASASAETEKN